MLSCLHFRTGSILKQAAVRGSLHVNLWSTRPRERPNFLEKDVIDLLSGSYQNVICEPLSGRDNRTGSRPQGVAFTSPLHIEARARITLDTNGAGMVA